MTAFVSRLQTVDAGLFEVLFHTAIVFFDVPGATAICIYVAPSARISFT
ncbi:MAG TPA: hypothetical protein VGL82_20045 [Bryobacteraceae bacterium]